MNSHQYFLNNFYLNYLLFLETQILFKQSIKNPERRPIGEDDLMPTEEQGLPSDLKFNILNDREDQYHQIMDVKKLMENSQILIRECEDVIKTIFFGLIFV